MDNKGYNDSDIDIKDMDYDNDSFLTDDTPFDFNSNVTLNTTTVQTTHSNNPIITTDPNSFIVLNILDSDKKLPELIKISNNLKPNQDIDENVDESQPSSNELAMIILNLVANLDKKMPNQIALDFTKKEIAKHGCVAQ